MTNPFAQYGTGRLVPRLLVTGGLYTALAKTWPLIAPGSHAPEWQIYAWAGAAAMALVGTGVVAAELAAVAKQIRRVISAHRPGDTLGSAGWLRRKEAKKAGLTKTNGLFLGILEGQPLFIETAVHGLICAPARKGKTTSFVMPALCHDIGASRLVTDMKGELTMQTARHIRERHGHTVIVLDPAHITGERSARYNPMRIILDNLTFAKENVIADARSMANQLHPDPADGARDPYWPNGTRKILTFALAAQCVLREPQEANLPAVYEMLGDNEALAALLEDADDSDELGGELAVLARGIRSTLESNPRQFDSFREGALQSLVAFGPSGHLAPSVEACDFRFRDLKRGKTTIFMVCDPTHADMFEPWIGLLVWAALRELVRERNAVPVHLLLDEFTNYKLSGLPAALTALGGYGIHVWMVVQELKEIARVYGAPALETILSQSDVKQFFGVAASETATLVSRMLGQRAVPTASFSLGTHLGEPAGMSMNASMRDLMRADELRQLPDDEQIIFIKNLKPVRALKAGYHEVEPWRSAVEPNPLHDGKPFIGKLKMSVRGRRAVAARAGRRKLPRDKAPLVRPVLEVLHGQMPRFPLTLIGAAVLAVLIFGWPHLRIQYAQNHAGQHLWCEYYGPPFVTQPFTRRGTQNCPVIIWSHSTEISQ